MPKQPYFPSTNIASVASLTDIVDSDGSLLLSVDEYVSNNNQAIFELVTVTISREELVILESYMVSEDIGHVSNEVDMSLDVSSIANDISLLVVEDKLALTSDLILAYTSLIDASELVDSLIADTTIVDDVVVASSESFQHSSNTLFVESPSLGSTGDIEIFTTPDTLIDVSSVLGAIERSTAASEILNEDMTQIFAVEELVSVAHMSVINQTSITASEIINGIEKDSTALGDASVLSSLSMMSMESVISHDEAVSLVGVEVIEFLNQLELEDNIIITCTEELVFETVSVFEEDELLGSIEFSYVESNEDRVYSDAGLISSEELLEVLSQLTSDDIIPLVSTDVFYNNSEISLYEQGRSGNYNVSFGRTLEEEVSIHVEETYEHSSVSDVLYEDSGPLRETEFFYALTEEVTVEEVVDIGTPISLHLVSSNPFLRPANSQDALIRYRVNVEPFIRMMPIIRLHKVASKPTLFKQGKLNVR